jgi:hypothetical protein
MFSISGLNLRQNKLAAEIALKGTTLIVVKRISPAQFAITMYHGRLTEDAGTRFTVRDGLRLDKAATSFRLIDDIAASAWKGSVDLMHHKFK